MAEKQELIIEINVQSSIDNLANLKTSLNDLTKARQDLNEKSKAGDLEATKQLEILNAAIRNTQQEYRTQQRIIDGYSRSVANNTDTVKFSNNSIQQNRDLLKQLTAQYINMKNATPEAAEKIKQLSDTLKQQEGAIGDTRRNVGNYTESIKQAVGELKIGNVQVSAISDGIKVAGNAFQAAGGGVKGFSAALATTGLPFIIAGIQGLINVLSSFRPIAEFTERVVNGISGGFSALVNGGNIVTAAEQIAELTKQQQKLNEEFRTAAIDDAKEEAQIKRLIAAAKDKSKSDSERISLLQRANQIAEENFLADKARQENQIALDEKNFAISKNLLTQKGEIDQRRVDLLVLSEESFLAKYDFYTKAKYKIDLERVTNSTSFSKEEIEKLSDNRKKLFEIEGNYQIFQEKQNTRIDEILDEIDAKNEKRLAAEKKLAEEKKAREEKRIKEQEDALKRLKEINDSVEEIANKAIEEQQRQDAIDEKIQQRKYDRYVKDYNDRQTALAQLEANANMQLDIQAKFNQTQEQVDAEFAASNYKTFKDYYDAKLKLYQKDFNAYQDTEKAKVFLANATADAFNVLANAVGEQTAAGIAFQKIAAGIQLAINTAQAISSAISGAASAAESSGPAAPFVLAGYIVSMVATVVGAVAQASQLLNSAGDVNPPKFAKGVIGLDGEGTETSDSIPAYLSKGESVMTAKATKEFHRELAMMEMAVGNKPNYRFGLGRFAGGFIPTMGDGGFVARDISRNNDLNAQIQQAIQNGFALAPAPKLSIVEFESKQNSRNRSVRVSEA